MKLTRIKTIQKAMAPDAWCWIAQQSAFKHGTNPKALWLEGSPSTLRALVWEARNRMRETVRDCPELLAEGEADLTAILSAL